MILVTGGSPFFPGGCFFFSPLRRKRKSFGSEGNFQIEIRRDGWVFPTVPRYITEFKSDTPETNMAPEKRMVGRLLSFWDGLFFRGEMLVSGECICIVVALSMRKLGSTSEFFCSQKQEALPKIIGVRFFYDYYSGRNDLSHYL